MTNITIEDFEVLERKLDHVIRNEKELPQHHLLQEEKKVKVFLKKGKIEYYKLTSGGKAPPLRILIQREVGTVIACVSGTEMFPDQKFCEGVFTGELISYYPKSKKSFSEFTYLSVLALENCEVSILTKFGQRLFLLQPSQNSLPEMSKSSMIKTISKKILDSILPIYATENTKKYKFSKAWSLRRSHANTRRTLKLSAKKEKTVFLMTRNSDAQKQKKIYTEFLENMQKKQKAWITFIVLNKCVAALRDKLPELATKQDSSARVRIRMLTNLNLNVNLQRTNLLLKIYHTTAFVVSKEFSKRTLCSAIRQSTDNNQIICAVDAFFIKFQNIHSKWKQNIQKSVERLNSMRTHWDKTISKLTEQGHMNREFAPLERDSILRKYIAEKKQEYNKKILNYFESTNYMKRKISQMFLATINHSEHVVQQGVPEFRCEPTTEEIAYLIREFIVNPSY